MILPERVLGRPGANWMASGEAMGPISLRTCWRSSVRSSSEGSEPSDDLRTELRNHVRKDIGPIASPDAIQFAPGLPKTRSGKIMRRILRKIAEDDYGSLGDTSTLADPSVVDDLIVNRQNRAG